MKKLLLLLLIVPLVSFGQRYNTAGRLEVEIVKSKKTRIEIQNEEIAARKKEAKDLKAELAAEQRAINRTKTDFKYFNSGIKKGKAKDYKGAINDLTKFISKYPKNPRGWSERGVYKTWLDDVSGACFDFKRGAELGSERAQKNLFEFCNSDGSVKEQKTYLDWNKDGVAKFNLKDWAGAIKDITNAIELKSDSPKLYKTRSRAKNQLKDWDGAIKDISIAIELGSEDAELYEWRVRYKIKKKDFNGALEDLNIAVSIDPEGMVGKQKYTELITKLKKKISSPESIMTKEKAIAKLKELKELLELEVITQKDYDKEKAILTPIILGKN